jgi:hypothetical protein
MPPHRLEQRLHADRGDETGQQDPLHADSDRQRAGDEPLRNEVAVTGPEAGDEGEVERIPKRPAFDRADRDAKPHHRGEQADPPVGEMLPPHRARIHGLLPKILVSAVQIRPWPPRSPGRASIGFKDI